jgi:HEAT repeat protein
MKRRETVPHLVGALGDRDHWVRSAAAAVLGQQTDEAAVPELEKLYADPEFLVRRNAALSVHKLGRFSGLKELLAMLEDADWRVRALVCGDIARMQALTALPGIRRLLKDPDWRVQVTAIQAVADLRDSQAAADLAGLLEHENVWVRRTAAHALAGLGADAAVSKYVAGVHARIGRLDGQPEQETFLAGLGGVAPWVRRQAEARLGIANDRSVLPGLAARMSQPQPYHQLAAARRLGELGDKAAIDALHQGLKSEDEWVRLACLDSLATFRYPNIHVQLVKALDGSLDWAVRQRAVSILGRLDKGNAEEAVRDSLGDAHPWVRLCAVDSWRNFKPEPAADQAFPAMESADGLEAAVPDEFRLASVRGAYVQDCLRERVREGEGAQRRVSVLALAHTHDTSGWETVARQLSDGQLAERVAAALTLGQIGEPRAIPAMLRQQKSGDPWTSHAVRGAVRSFGNAAVPVLVEALNDGDEGVRSTAHATIEDIVGTQVAFDPKEKAPERRAAAIRNFLSWWDDFTFVLGLGYESVALFQKAHALAISGLIDAETQARIKELREQKSAKPEGP